MKILLAIYLLISIITLVFGSMMAIIAVKKIKKEYPNIKFYKKTILERICACFRAIIICFCPIVNLIALLSMTLNYEEVQKRAIENIYNTDVEDFGD